MTAYMIDVTKAAILAHPNMHVIRDAEGRIIALCPLYDENVCDGQFSFAPIVERALNSAAPVVSVKVMRLSDGRADYYVSIAAGAREVTPHVFREEYKAAYHVALYRWLLNNGPDPGILEFSAGGWPAQPTIPAGNDLIVTRLVDALLHAKPFVDRACQAAKDAGNFTMADILIPEIIESALSAAGARA
ncbi:hypothetical protein [Shinella zoogloeoides]|uniref:hypothetical protein n=1 Tax=Shinella zoogloeoides TaxID=352475 RepID=UPI00299D316A|nr:hypothetical protein [Shinella zoogloeoides]WPE19906.1 hypothetical protein ShzoTeo12_10820 [Shinella zoogloeoides]